MYDPQKKTLISYTLIFSFVLLNHWFQESDFLGKIKMHTNKYTYRVCTILGIVAGLGVRCSGPQCPTEDNWDNHQAGWRSNSVTSTPPAMKRWKEACIALGKCKSCPS
jgi:hypothetical protein